MDIALGFKRTTKRFKFLQPLLFFLIGFPLVLTGCGVLPLEREALNTTLTPYFIAPTKAPPMPLPQSGLTPSITPTAACKNELTFVADISLPDGITVGVSVPLKKLWKVQNSGTCNWDRSYSLRLLTGADLGAAILQPLYPARSGTDAIFEIEIVTPVEPGNYTASWQAFDPQGNLFGDPLFIDIMVVSE